MRGRLAGRVCPRAHAAEGQLQLVVRVRLARLLLLALQRSEHGGCIAHNGPLRRPRGRPRAVPHREDERE